MMEAFEDGFDNCIMRNKESEEGRQIKFSWEDDKDEKKNMYWQLWLEWNSFI